MRNCKCQECNRLYTYKRNAGHTLDKCNSYLQRKRRNQMRDRSVAYKGNACLICNYDRSVHALSFHHINPNKKDFAISGNYNLSWERVKSELDKCVLLCMNCHAEVHAGIATLP